MPDTIIYIRTSTEEQNPENQLRDCESIRPRIKGCDAFVDYSLFEEKRSAFNDAMRPEFERILGLIRQRRVRNIIVWDLDRLYRDRKKLLSFFELCRIYKCRVYSFRQGFLEEFAKMPSPFDELMFNFMIQILGWIAEDESRRKSARVKAAIRIKGGKAFSYNGKVWGRPKLSTFKKNRIIALHKENLSIRRIAKDIGVSLGSVHKVVSEFKEKISDSGDVSVAIPLSNGSEGGLYD